MSMAEDQDMPDAAPDAALARLIL
ncbi:MAG: hypothetical protein JWP73_1599, partial [Phenylobacterium sp.]|nr:hypothetical protein [Phenylobacterium sp.]